MGAAGPDATPIYETFAPDYSPHALPGIPFVAYCSTATGHVNLYLNSTPDLAFEGTWATSQGVGPWQYTPQGGGAMWRSDTSFVWVHMTVSSIATPHTITTVAISMDWDSDANQCVLRGQVIPSS